MTPRQGMMVVTFMDGQLFAEAAENNSKHRPAITSSPTEARETDSKWKVAGFVTRRMTAITLAIFAAAALRERDRVVVVWKTIHYLMGLPYYMYT
jgi:hypothetical protein